MRRHLTAALLFVCTLAATAQQPPQPPSSPPPPPPAPRVGAPPAPVEAGLQQIEKGAADIRKYYAGAPVDCVQSDWTVAKTGPWSACSAGGTQTRDVLYRRTVVTWPINGGAQCGPLTKTETESQPCTAPSSPLLQAADLVYECTFRVPVSGATVETSFGYGGTGLAFWPAHQSLLMVGHDWAQYTAEISIPANCLAGRAGRLGADARRRAIDEHPRATLLQPFTDVLQGKRLTVDGGTENGVNIGGHAIDGTRIVVNTWTYYDASQTPQRKTHFATGQTFGALTPAAVSAPVQVAQGFYNVVSAPAADHDKRIGGFVSGYLATIPTEWRGALGGTHLAGQGGGVSILTRTSSGPSATVFSAADVGVKGPPVPGAIVMGYPSDSGNPSSPLHHPTQGTWGVDGGLYNGMQSFRGMVFPEGTRSILFFGWGGTSFCYGAVTTDPAMDGEPVPGQPGQIYCYDPSPGASGTGPHGYPMRSIVWAYDVNDFIAAKQGKIKPWDVAPYATWSFQMPYQARPDATGVDLGIYDTVGAAYDPATRRVFLTAYRNDGDAPLVHVYRIRPPVTRR